eukprot:Sspe_Gene.87396::Locus_58593_Transcript_1_1_Confidence_1.000_Length_633::g.87396::m.87396
MDDSKFTQLFDDGKAKGRTRVTPQSGGTALQRQQDRLELRQMEYKGKGAKGLSADDFNVETHAGESNTRKHLIANQNVDEVERKMYDTQKAVTGDGPDVFDEEVDIMALGGGEPRSSATEDEFDVY